MEKQLTYTEPPPVAQQNHPPPPVLSSGLLPAQETNRMPGSGRQMRATRCLWWWRQLKKGNTC
jgi:hypothetical protein